MFDSEKSIEEKLKELLPNNLLSKIDSNRVKNWKTLVEKALQETDYAPNENQLGVSIAAALQFATYKRQLWIVGPG